ncbi:MAG: hypothetical protein ABSB49_20900 [Polyangia bacterium]|jgi:hypothetical protein
MKTAKLTFLGLLVLGGVSGCAHTATFPGTNIKVTQANREIIDTIEEYRQRVMARNVEGLLLLASPNYFEDGGTPQANDDYGYAGLASILSSRLQRVESIRYDIQYKSIRIRNDGRAEVEAYLSGAFELQGEVGDRYRRVNDFHRFVLEPAPHGSFKWKFVAGM